MRKISSKLEACEMCSYSYYFRVSKNLEVMYCSHRSKACCRLKGIMCTLYKEREGEFDSIDSIVSNEL